VCTLVAIIKSSGNFPGYFEVNQRLVHLHGKARKTFWKNSEAVGAITDETFPCELQPAGEFQGIMLKIYCEKVLAYG